MTKIDACINNMHGMGHIVILAIVSVILLVAH
jgi:hypothetical protein